MPTRAKGEVLHEYIVTGRKLPTEKEPVTPIYKMQIFASNTIIAKSHFWYFISMLRRLKKANREILECRRYSVLLNLRTSFPGMDRRVDSWKFDCEGLIAVYKNCNAIIKEECENDTDSLDNSYGSAEGIHGRFQSSADVENDNFRL
ncbi:hypothetical protein PRIPAC_94373 [Pristionchus pacificus]|uniref:Ribosomal protein n=1 Tax=Pristionchus pacificus TaxID=54126 RepID=A0A2A6CHV0_PRIPA|nr:hypothetical protein PRIPAC_94373 [Pristionchus pacificus]|eukprot:PDM77601.1 ribosomal protein [Pristionchus pacificus]